MLSRIHTVCNIQPLLLALKATLEEVWDAALKYTCSMRLAVSDVDYWDKMYFKICTELIYISFRFIVCDL